MECLRSGYCCIHYDVVIVDDPYLGIVENNLKIKPAGTRCQHLIGNEPGHYECAIHSKDYYEQTPCFQHTQIGKGSCRIGVHALTLKV
jgi:hypothetical protein